MIRSVVLVLLSCVVMLGCSRRPPVPPSSSAPRVVVLSPALAITMHDLGMAHLIVGRHAWDTVTDPSALPLSRREKYDKSGRNSKVLVKALK